MHMLDTGRIHLWSRSLTWRESRQRKRLPGGKQRTNSTYPQTLATRILRAFQCVFTGVENDGGGVRGVIPDVGGDGVGIHKRKHIKDPKNLIEVQLPASNRLFVVLCMISSRDRIPFTPLD